MAYIPATPDLVNAANSTATPLESLTITGASWITPNLVLTGIWLTDATRVGQYFNVTGFTAAGVGNNGYFICTAQGANTITLTDVGGFNGFTGAPIAGRAFTGTSFDCTATAISKISLICDSNKSSALAGLQLQFSSDNVNWDLLVSATVTGGITAALSCGVYARYCRIVYINGTQTQTIMRLETIVSATPISPTTKSLTTGATSSDSATLTRSVLTGKAFPLTLNYTDVVTDVYGSLQTVIGGQAADSFGRVRTASPASLFDSQFIYSMQPLLFTTSLVGSGTVAKTSGESSLTLSTGGTTNTWGAINQTKQYFHYEPGKSQQIVMTGILGAQKANVRSRIGYFDANDGIFFEMNGADGAAVVQRSSIGGIVDTRILQANWNFDRMDGTGPSGITLDFSKTQIFAIDFQWLGVGRVRFGFFNNGVLLICHQIYNDNIILSPYMNTANLPLRAEIFNTGTAATTTTMKQICMVAVSEGGTDNPSAYQFSAANGGNLISGISTRQPLVTIRAKATFNSIVNRALIELQDFDVYDNSSPGAYWELVYNGTLTGGAGAWVSADANSVVEYNVDRTGCANGVVVASGYVSGGGKSQLTVGSLTRLPIALDVAGASPDTLSLCVSSVGTNIAAAGAMRWKEIR